MIPVMSPVAGQPPRLLERVRTALRVLHYSMRTEDAYVDWARRFILFHNKRHPQDMAEAEIGQFLTHLAVKGKVAASTQNQALAALLFLYQKVLDKPLQRIDAFRAKRPKRLPIVLSRPEVERLLAPLQGTYRLIARLLYGSGLRVLECLRLRVQDLDFGQAQILVRHGKGGNDRRTMLPRTLVADLQDHLQRVRQLHQEDLTRGFGNVLLPYAFDRKAPQASRDWRWQFVFPSVRISADPRSHHHGRHHAHAGAVGRAITAAARQAGLAKRASPHTLRHSFATHLDRSRLRHPDGPGVTGAPGCGHHHDLYARAEQTGPGSDQPSGRRVQPGLACASNTDGLLKALRCKRRQEKALRL